MAPVIDFCIAEPPEKRQKSIFKHFKELLFILGKGLDYKSLYYKYFIQKIIEFIYLIEHISIYLFL